MKNFALAVMLLCSTITFAAPTLTNVTATLQDSSTQVWANATWTAQFSPASGYNGPYNNHGSAITVTQNGTADGSGVFTVTLDDNIAGVSPAGSGWKFTICPNASVTSCNTILLTITGGSQNISTQLNAAITVPVVNAAPIIARAYNDTEANGSYGALYINSISNAMMICNQLACNGSGWVPVASGGLTHALTMNNSGSGAASGSTFDGSAARTISYNTIGAAPLASPVFTGTPAAPTAAPGTNTTQLATTAFVLANAGGGGNVSSSGVPLNHQIAAWIDATHIQGLTPSTSGFVLTSNGTGADPTFQAPSTVGGFPAPNGSEHFISFNNSTTLSAASGNNWPGGLWSQLGGAFTVLTTVPGANDAPPNYRLITTGGGAGASSSLAEDAVSQQATFNIFGAYACYCSTEIGAQHIVWMGFSSILYGSLTGSVNPTGTIFGFRYAATVDTNYQAYVSTSNVSFTATDTGFPVDDHFHQFAFRKNGTGGIDFYIDGTLVATVASGATGFPVGNTNVYAIAENGLLGAASNLSLFINSIRWWSAK